MKNWKVPAVIFGLLILAFVFRWGDLGISTNNGTTIKTRVDHWNGSVWQTTIKNGSYNEKIISPSWFESMRKPIEKTEEYKEAVYSKPLPKPDPLYGQTFTINRFDSLLDNVTYVTKTRTVQVPPLPMYWLSSNGLLKIWIYVNLVVGIWLIVAVVITGKKRNLVIKK